MKSRDLVNKFEHLTLRKLDYWCHNGVFEPAKANTRSVRRTFSDDEVRIAAVLDRVSGAFDSWSNGRGGFVAIYREIAKQMRDGGETISVELAPSVSLVVDAGDVAGPPPVPTEPQLPPEEFPAPGEPTMNLLETKEEPGFIPGVGADNV